LSLDALLAEADCGALLVVAHSARDPYLAPFAPAARLGECFVLAARGRPPRLGYLTPMERDEAASTGLDLLTPELLDLPRWLRDGNPPDRVWADILARAFHLSELPPCRVALAGMAQVGRFVAVAGHLESDGYLCVPGESLVGRFRRRKDARQLDGIRAAAAGTMAAFRAIAERLSGASHLDGGDLSLSYAGQPLRVGDLKAVAYQVFAEHRLEASEGLIVAPAEEGAVPHSSGSNERVLRAGESLVVDLFPRGALFADCTRTFCVGEPPEQLRRQHADALAVLELAESQARPGVRGWHLQSAVCAELAARGWRTPISDPGTLRGYVHNLGHGVGFELHDLPSFKEFPASEADGTLAVDDVITLEPGLYEPELGVGVRIEDLYRVLVDGVENLTPLPRALDPRVYRS
jgi:Xaa-Pro aminopeptidase